MTTEPIQGSLTINSPPRRDLAKADKILDHLWGQYVEHTDHAVLDSDLLDCGIAIAKARLDLASISGRPA